MLVNFFNSRNFRQTHDLSFSFRDSELYKEGLKQRLKEELPVYPLNFPDPQNIIVLLDGFPPVIRRVIGSLMTALATFPILVIQIIILSRLLRKLTPDILHINNGGYPGALSSRAAAIAGKIAGVPKILMVVNNMAIDYSRWSRRFDYPFDRIVVRSVDLFITGSRAASSRLAGVLKLADKKFMSIHNGISMRKATESVDETKRRIGLAEFGGVVFGVVALLIPRKGHMVLLEAVRAIIDERQGRVIPMRIMIEGDGPLRQELVDFVDKYDLKSFVHFLGNEANVVNFMNALDVLILPSVQDEDFPNVVLEAMALGKPVISSRLAGTPEQVIDGKSGILVAPSDPAGMARAMGLLMDESSMRKTMGSYAAERFKTCFTNSVSLKNYTHMYQQLIGGVRRNHA